MELEKKYLVEAQSAKEAVTKLVKKPLVWMKKELKAEQANGNEGLVAFHMESIKRIEDSLDTLKVSNSGELFKVTTDNLTYCVESFYYVNKADDMFVVEVYSRTKNKEGY